MVATPTPAVADPEFLPLADDLVAVGDSTTQYVLNDFAAAYNRSHTGGRIASFDAVNPATGQRKDQITIRPGVTMVRPESAYAAFDRMKEGKPIDFAHTDAGPWTSTRPNMTTFVVFAKDQMRYASARVTNVPQNLTKDQLKAIYTCQAKTWNQVGGTSTSKIQLKMPVWNDTLRNYMAQLGVSGPYTCWSGDQWNDISTVLGNPDAIVPMSRAVARLMRSYGDPIQIDTSDVAVDYYVYNVVRNDDTPPDYIPDRMIPFVGDGSDNTGWICGTEAQAIVRANGFDSTEDCGMQEWY
nr:hypothetical protein [Kibdelosporangium sp. MJ126-NF4]